MLYPVLLVAGGFRPQVRRLPAVLAFLFGSALPIYFLNKVLYTNFYFLNGPTSSPVTALFTQWFGEQWYLLGFLPAVALVLAGMYLPWDIHRKNRSNLIWLLFVKNYDTLKMLSEMAARHCIQRQAVRLFIPLKRG